VKAGARPQEAGKQIARAVFRGLRHQAASATASRIRRGPGGGQP
jgi:hypothetical protein